MTLKRHHSDVKYVQSVLNSLYHSMQVTIYELNTREATREQLDSWVKASIQISNELRLASDNLLRTENALVDDDRNLAMAMSRLMDVTGIELGQPATVVGVNMPMKDEESIDRYTGTDEPDPLDKSF